MPPLSQIAKRIRHVRRRKTKWNRDSISAKTLIEAQQAMYGLEHYVRNSGLEKQLLELVKTR